MSLNSLSEALWRERRLLEMLLFKLEEEQLVLTSGRSRWLAQATREVESVLDEIRSAEIARAMEVEEVAPQLGLAGGASLGELAQAAPAPWDELLRAHRDAFATVTAEIGRLADDNRELLMLSHRATQETLASLEDSVRTYDVTGQPRAEVRAAQLIDRSI
jgi:hypothetical protein